MDPVYCTNTECTEYALPKGNADLYPTEDIRCGGCGGHVSGENPEDVEPEPEPEPEP